MIKKNIFTIESIGMNEETFIQHWYYFFLCLSLTWWDMHTKYSKR